MLYVSDICSFLAIKKRLAEVAKLSPFGKLANWIRSITNHFHWTVDTTDPGSQLREEKWKSTLYHIQNQHEFPGKVYRSCEHDERPARFGGDDGEMLVRDYIIPGWFHDFTFCIAVQEKFLRFSMIDCTCFQ